MIILKCPVLAIPYICAHCAHWGFRGLPIFLMCRDVPGIRFVFASVPNSGPNSLKPLFGTPILICRIRYCGWQAIYWKSTFSLICGLTFGETSPRREIQPLRCRTCYELFAECWLAYRAGDYDWLLGREILTSNLDTHRLAPKHTKT